MRTQAPSITTQPADQSVLEGASASFSVTAVGTPPLAYQWNCNGTPIGGATASTYEIASAEISQDGKIFCVVVSNDNGQNSVTSDDATLTVTVTPSITTQPVDQSVLEGTRASFSVAADGTPPLAYQWNCNGTPIGGATASTYELENASTSDSGKIFCVVVSNDNGQNSVTSDDATLTVTQPPSITTQPADQSVLEGARASFSVTAVGTPPLAYQWNCNGTPIGGATASTYEIAIAMTSDDGNRYCVVVSNDNGQNSVTSDSATLTLMAQDSLTSGLYMVFVNSSNEAYLAWMEGDLEGDWTVFDGPIATDVSAPPALVAIGSGRLAVAYVQSTGALTLATTTDGKNWTTTDGPIFKSSGAYLGQYSAGLSVCDGYLYIGYPSFQNEQTINGVNDKGPPQLQYWSLGQLEANPIPPPGSAKFIQYNANVNQNWGGVSLVSMENHGDSDGDSDLRVVFPISPVGPDMNWLNWCLGIMESPSTFWWKYYSTTVQYSKGGNHGGYWYASGRAASVITGGNMYITACMSQSPWNISSNYYGYGIGVLGRSAAVDSTDFWTAVGPTATGGVTSSNVCTPDSSIFMSPALATDGSNLVLGYHTGDGSLVIQYSALVPNPNSWHSASVGNIPETSQDPALAYLLPS